jgi:hypothetical protein
MYDDRALESIGKTTERRAVPLSGSDGLIPTRGFRFIYWPSWSWWVHYGSSRGSETLGWAREFAAFELHYGRYLSHLHLFRWSEGETELAWKASNKVNRRRDFSKRTWNIDSQGLRCKHCKCMLSLASFSMESLDSTCIIDYLLGWGYNYFNIKPPFEVLIENVKFDGNESRNFLNQQVLWFPQFTTLHKDFF